MGTRPWHLQACRTNGGLQKERRLAPPTMIDGGLQNMPEESPKSITPLTSCLCFCSCLICGSRSYGATSISVWHRFALLASTSKALAMGPWKTPGLRSTALHDLGDLTANDDVASGSEPKDGVAALDRTVVP